MQDINILENIHAGRDVVINGGGDQIKLLGQCTNAELKEEEKYRRELLRGEQKRRTSASLSGFLFGAVLVLVGAGMIYLRGGPDLVSAVCGVLGILISLRELSNGDIPTKFELRQLEALEEISMLLRERGVR